MALATYSDFQTRTANGRNTMSWSNTQDRQAPFPIEKYSIFPNYATARAYAAGEGEYDGLPYEGQIISVTENEKQVVYILDSTATNYLRKVTSDVDSGTFDPSDIADGAIDDSKLSAGTIVRRQLADGGIATSRIADGAIDDSKLSGTIVGSQLADGSIAIDRIANGAIDENKLSAGNIIGSQLADNSIAIDRIANGAVDDSKLSGTIVGSQLADGSIATNRIAEGAIDSTKLSAGTIVGSQLADSSIAVDRIVDGAIDENKLSAGNIIGSQLADNSIAIDRIANGAIDENKLSAGSITGSQLADGSIAISRIENNAIDSAKLSAGSIAGSQLANSSIATSRIGANQISANHIAGQIVGSQLADEAITGLKIASGTVSVVNLASDVIDELNSLKAPSKPFDLCLSSDGQTWYINNGSFIVSNTELSVQDILVVQTHDPNSDVQYSPDMSCYLKYSYGLNASTNSIEWSDARLAFDQSTTLNEYAIKIYELSVTTDVKIKKDFRGINLPITRDFMQETVQQVPFTINGVEVANIAADQSIQLDIVEQIVGGDGISVSYDPGNTHSIIISLKDSSGGGSGGEGSGEEAVEYYSSNGAMIPSIADLWYDQTTHKLKAKYMHISYDNGKVASLSIDSDWSTTILSAVEEDVCQCGSGAVNAAAYGQLCYSSNDPNAFSYSAAQDSTGDIVYKAAPPSQRQQNIAFSIFPLTSDCSTCGNVHTNSLNISALWNNKIYNQQVGDFAVNISPTNATTGTVDLALQIAARQDANCSEDQHLSCGMTVTIDDITKVVGPFECPLGTTVGVGQAPLSATIHIVDSQLHDVSIATA